MKRWRQSVCILAFLILCGSVLIFLRRFTQAESPFVYPVWEQAAVVTADGAETPVDQNALPMLSGSAYYRFTAHLPEDRKDGETLIFETTGMEAAVFLDGQEVWRSASNLLPDTVNQAQAYIPLPAGGGERLVLEVRPLAETALLPPFLRLSADPGDQAGTIAYANYYGFPAGASAALLILLWGLFLLGILYGKWQWELLLPLAAAALLMLYRLSVGYGVYFLPTEFVQFLTGSWMEALGVLLLAVYLLWRRDRLFWRALGLAAAWSAVVLFAAAVFSRMQSGALWRLLSELAAQLRAGIWNGTLYWLSLWLVLLCTLLSAWELSRMIARTKSESVALMLRNQLILENYDTLKRKLRETAELRHEFRHRLAAMDALAKRQDLERLMRCIADWSDAVQKSPLVFTENFTVNAIVQDAAARAQARGITFHVSVSLSKELPVSDEDLCTLLMNLLDNALKGAERTPQGQEKSIFFQMKRTGNFLPLLCENTFDGQVETDGKGRLKTREKDADSHGFGMAQMNAVAKKYGSVLDISWTDSRFTVQTALQLPGEENGNRSVQN